MIEPKRHTSADATPASKASKLQINTSQNVKHFEQEINEGMFRLILNLSCMYL